MFSSLRRWLNKSTVRPLTKRGRRPALQVEALEGRDVPTVAFTPHFGAETTGGSTAFSLQSPPVNLVFSGSTWNTTQGQQDRATLTSSVQSIFSSPYLSALTQYGSDGKATLGSTWTDSALSSTNPSATALQNFLQGSISRHNVNPGQHDAQHLPVFVVISDPTSSAGSNGGFNAPGNFAYTVVKNLPGEPGVEFIFNENIRMIWISTRADATGHVSKDAFTDLFSHEIVETMANSIVVTPPSGLPSNVAGDHQISDDEPDGGRYQYRLNGNLVQAYWSTRDGAFIVPDGNSQTFTLDPNWTGNSFNFNFNLHVQGDQFGANFADNIRVDAIGASTAVTLNQQRATFEPSQIATLSIDTVGGANNVRIAGVAAGVTLNLDSSGQSNDFVVIGSDGGSLAGIQGNVNVSNSSGHTWLEIYDTADAPTTITLTDHSVTVGSRTINYQGGFQWNSGAPVDGVTTLEIDDPLGANLINALSVDSLTNTMVLGTSTDVLFGPAANQVHLYRTR